MEKWRAVKRGATVKVPPLLSSPHAPRFEGRGHQKGHGELGGWREAAPEHGELPGGEDTGVYSPGPGLAPVSGTSLHLSVPLLPAPY